MSFRDPSNRSARSTSQRSDEDGADGPSSADRRGISPSHSFESKSSTSANHDDGMERTTSRNSKASDSSRVKKFAHVVKEKVANPVLFGRKEPEACIFGSTDCLDLSNYRMGPNVSHLLDSLRLCTSLSKMDLSGINMDTDTASKLARLFRKTRLAEMILERAHVNSHSLKILYSSGMKDSSSLTSLSLKGSILSTSDQCKWISKIMQECTSLQTLNLASCGLGNLGCVCICHALCENRTLKSLDLSANKVGMLGAEGLRRAVQAQTVAILGSLQSLYVDSSPAGHTGGLDTLILRDNKSWPPQDPRSLQASLTCSQSALRAGRACAVTCSPRPRFSLEAFASITSDLHRLHLLRLPPPDPPHPETDSAPSSPIRGRPPPRPSRPPPSSPPAPPPEPSLAPHRQPPPSPSSPSPALATPSIALPPGAARGPQAQDPTEDTAAAEDSRQLLGVASMRSRRGGVAAEEAEAAAEGKAEFEVQRAAGESVARMRERLLQKRAELTVELEQPRRLHCVF